MSAVGRTRDQHGRFLPGTTLTPEERFWSKVDKNGPTMPHMTTQCWVWTAGTAAERAPYGHIYVGGRAQQAHRVSYQWAYGELPDLIDHICVNHPCVRPDHLRPATAAQNQENRRGPTRLSQSGVRGVYWDSATSRWAAMVCQNGVRFWLGRFTSIDAAETAAVAKRRELFTYNAVDRCAS